MKELRCSSGKNLEVVIATVVNIDDREHTRSYRVYDQGTMRQLIVNRKEARAFFENVQEGDKVLYVIFDNKYHLAYGPLNEDNLVLYRAREDNSG